MKLQAARELIRSDDPTHNLMLCGALILLAMLFDAVDGQIARLTRGVSSFGAELDSLCDLVSFGIAPAILLVLCVGAVVGTVNGLIVTVIGINPLITTLGTLSITSGLAYSLSDGVTIPFDNPDAGVLADKTAGDISYYVILLLALSIIAFLTLRYSVFGRMLYAIGGNREASRLAGMRVNLVTVLVYVLCSSLAGLAGVIVASQLLAGSATVATKSSARLGPGVPPTDG